MENNGPYSALCRSQQTVRWTMENKITVHSVVQETVREMEKDGLYTALVGHTDRSLLWKQDGPYSALLGHNRPFVMENKMDRTVHSAGHNRPFVGLKSIRWTVQCTLQVTTDRSLYYGEQDGLYSALCRSLQTFRCTLRTRWTQFVDNGEQDGPYSALCRSQQTVRLTMENKMDRTVHSVGHNRPFVGQWRTRWTVTTDRSLYYGEQDGPYSALYRSQQTIRWTMENKMDRTVHSAGHNRPFVGLKSIRWTVKRDCLLDYGEQEGLYSALCRSQQTVRCTIENKMDRTVHSLGHNRPFFGLWRQAGMSQMDQDGPYSALYRSQQTVRWTMENKMDHTEHSSHRPRSDNGKQDGPYSALYVTTDRSLDYGEQDGPYSALCMSQQTVRWSIENKMDLTVHSVCYNRLFVGLWRSGWTVQCTLYVTTDRSLDNREQDRPYSALCMSQQTVRWTIENKMGRTVHSVGHNRPFVGQWRTIWTIQCTLYVTTDRSLDYGEQTWYRQ
ncbi:Hypothetical predicted protein [Mytilus galloprovincialis]|uniref:Uncharacterized protein n=1 Tax=Mytilus galloprovincialis TaxID=29158 RepID=A0A8B6FV44_MYTGA|nr:Hypothetical predicted protein [Mytilus galloprovincialis]